MVTRRDGRQEVVMKRGWRQKLVVEVGLLQGEKVLAGTGYLLVEVLEVAL